MSKRKQLSRFFVWSAATMIGVLALIALVAEHKLSSLVVGGLGESFSTRVFGAPYIVPDALPTLRAETLLEHLRRRGYERVRGKPEKPGTFAWTPPVLSIFVRGFTAPTINQPAALYRLIQSSEFSWSIRDDAGNPAGQVALEPEIVAELSGPQKVRRDPAAWDEIPSNLVNAVVSIEDRRFFRHWGLDPRAIGRALWHNLRRPGLEGGSTITQQLAKNLFLKPKRTIGRKIKEAGLALYLNVRFSKQRILTLYLNQIYMGQDGYVSVAGVKAAAHHYFSKDLKDLTLEECATLAGLIRSPHHYNPLANPVESVRRRNLVLKRMKEEGFIDEEAYARAAASPLTAMPATKEESVQSDNGYYIAEVVRELLPSYSEDDLFRHGLKIYTAMDPILQQKAQAAVKLPKKSKNKNQAAMVVLDPKSGAVLAIVGGRDYRESQFNRATQAVRQPGSAFKPFVYGAAIEENVTPATLLQDEPRAYSDGQNGIWAPQNYDGVYHGTVTVRTALANSLNAATLYLAEQIGPAQVIRFARKMGITSDLPKDLSIALGSAEVSPLEITSAYAPFANGGFRVTPRVIVGVVDAENEVLEARPFERISAIDPALAFLMTSLLQSVVEEGTAHGLLDLGWTYPTAGKTGTTNEGRDAWFIGYTPDLLVGVWTGNDGGKGTNLVGGKHAIPLWAGFMKEAYRERPHLNFEKPAGLITITIDPVSGLLPRSGCPTRTPELFISGTEPKEFCNLHSGGFKGWIHRLFGGD